MHLLISSGASLSLSVWRGGLLRCCVCAPCITDAFFAPKRRDSCIICMHSIHQQLKVFYSDAAAAFSSLNAFFNPFRPLCGMNMRVVLLRALCTLTPWMLAALHASVANLHICHALQPAASVFRSRQWFTTVEQFLLFRMKSLYGTNLFEIYLCLLNFVTKGRHRQFFILMVFAVL